jgi:hypothetical protein
MAKWPLVVFLWAAAAFTFCTSTQAEEKERLFLERINVEVPHIASDSSVRYDYDIVYVRAQRVGDRVHKRFYTDIAAPVTMEPNADLMLLHPDGSEEVLVASGEEGAITDPFVSFEGEWVYYTHIHTLKDAGQWSMPKRGADIFKIHVATRRIVRLTNQRFTPNTGAARWADDVRKAQDGRTHLDYGVLNFGACPLPGGRIVFTSNRNAYRPPRGYPQITLQMFVMDDRDESIGDDEEPQNLEQIGYLNIAGALHPVVMTDGRIMFSSLESQGIRGEILWGIWTINPDGTGWNPMVSAFDPGGAPNGFHFQSQLSDGSPIIEGYYNQNNSGFGTYIKLAREAEYPAFGPAKMDHPRNKPWRMGRFDNGRPQWYRMPFMPAGSEMLTPFTHMHDGPAHTSIVNDKDSPRVGKFTHPSGAPDNHLLTIYSPGPTNHQYTYLPQLDGGIYLIKDGRTIEEPAQMLLIKNDPDYNESWPRALVSYQRIYGIDEPNTIEPLSNDGQRSKHLPEGTPFAIVGTASLYKRESYPNGAVRDGAVTASFAGKDDPWRGLDAFTSHGNGMPLNWHNQGADAGLYSNDDIHAIRILAMEPTTDRHRGEKSGRLFHSHAQERLRILGEIPVRKFKEGEQPLDVDGNPDTSFLARIPADTAFTFQTLDKHGLVLNMAQTWHQLRPGEVRHDCGGCHAHSQKPTDFSLTRAARDDYRVWDLVNETPLLSDKSRDESKQQWDVADEAGLRISKQGIKNVEYHRDIRPILARSCAACHTERDGARPAGTLNLDADDELVEIEHRGRFPGTYVRLALDERAKFGHKPVGYDSWGYPQASRYVRMLQSRRSMLVWKLFGRRLDGFSNDDHPSESEPGSGALVQNGAPVDKEKNRHKWDVDFVGSQMPPREAVEGIYTNDSGKKIKVEPLSDEDRRTIARWIDLGCPIDLDYSPESPDNRGFGWMCDDNRPTLTVTLPRLGKNTSVDRILIGMHDFYSGIDADSFNVTADVAINGKPAGENLAPLFEEISQGVRQLKLLEPIESREKCKLVVAVRDRQGNKSHIERTFWRQQ